MNNLLGLKLFWEFFKIGTFAVGGGPATLPYLMELSEKFDWFTMEELTNMIAVSESTPGPLGLNMATYVGYQTMGIWGGVIATMGLVLPSLIIISIIAAFFAKFNNNRFVKAAFGAIRPSVTAIIAAAVVGICKVTLFVKVDEVINPQWKIIIFSIIVLGLLQIKVLKKIHPFLWFVLGAIVGLVFLF
ncbi:MAG: chromate transporter [Treponema sp.]|nr:chromate transporter [Treponema sp.]